MVDDRTGNPATAYGLSLPRVLPTLTGLRAVAAGLVFFRHTEYLFDGSSVSHWTWRLFVQGGVGVSFFYVLSGFVLTWSWRPGIFSFYRRRVARIYPMYVTTWILGGVVALYVGARVTPKIAVSTLLLVQAWIPNPDFFIGMNGVSWSLSCEAFFYLLFPVLVVFLFRMPSWGRRFALLACVLAVVAVPVFANQPTIIRELWITYIFPPTRALEFVCGVIVALELKAGRWPRVPVGVAWAVALAGYLAAGQAGLWQAGAQWFTVYYGYAAVTIVPFVLLIGAYASRDVTGARSIFRRTVAIRLGEWSYAFYLVHFLVIQVFQHLTPAWHPGVPAAIAATLSLLVVSLTSAALLYHFVERPLERRIRGSLRTPTAELVARDAAGRTVGT